MYEDIINPTPITRRLATEEERVIFTSNLFGVQFLTVETMICRITERMAADYHGGYWHFYILSSGSFYMAPEGDQVYQVSCDNFFTGELSADALGIAACLYAFSHCSFSSNHDFGRICARQYHLLRMYMFDHPEVSAILGAID